jgi:flagellar biogenesis protein FliO
MEVMEFLLKLIVSVFVLGAFLFGFLFFIKKRGMLFPALMNGNGNMQIISHMKLTPKAHIFLVRIDNSKFIIGVTEGNISFYHMKEKEPN